MRKLKWARTHELKTWPVYFSAIWRKRKTFEIRKADRDFKVGERLLLREYKACKNCKGKGGFDLPNTSSIKTTCPYCKGKGHKGKTGYTGRMMLVRINYILRSGFGLLPGYCLMAIKIISKHEKTKNKHRPA